MSASFYSRSGNDFCNQDAPTNNFRSNALVNENMNSIDINTFSSQNLQKMENPLVKVSIESNENNKSNTNINLNPLNNSSFPMLSGNNLNNLSLDYLKNTFSKSSANITNYEILNGPSFRHELMKRYSESKVNSIVNNKSNSLNNKTLTSNLNVTDLLEQINYLKNENNSFKHENMALKANNNDLTNEISNLKKVNHDQRIDAINAKTLIMKYNQLLKIDFDFFQKLKLKINSLNADINNNSNNNEEKMDINYYLNNENEYNQLINSLNRWIFDNINNINIYNSNANNELNESNNLNNDNNNNISNDNNYYCSKTYPFDLNNNNNNVNSQMNMSSSYVNPINFNEKLLVTKSGRKELNEISEFNGIDNPYNSRLKNINNDKCDRSLSPVRQSVSPSRDCFACNLGMSVSNNGYSPMTYSPYEMGKVREIATKNNISLLKHTESYTKMLNSGMK